MSHLVALLSHTMIPSKGVTMTTRCLGLVPRINNMQNISRKCIHTTHIVCLRKAPKSGKFMGIDTWWRYLPWPSYLIKALIRRKIKPEKLGPDEEYRKSIFHRLSLFYAFITWVGMGVAIYWMIRVRPKEAAMLEEEKKKLPYQEDLDKGGALWWINALKSPEEMQDMKRVRVIKFSGLSYVGTEDATLKVKEIGQQRAREMYEQSDDYYLRKRYKFLPEEQGGPTNQEIRDQFKAEGKDYELELDWSNNRAGRKTNYNPDGTVGSFMNPIDYETKMKKPKTDAPGWGAEKIEAENQLI